MKEKIKTAINRKDWPFIDFLKKYWWIEFLGIIKVVYFINKDYYGFYLGFAILAGFLLLMWVLYRLGLE